MFDFEKIAKMSIDMNRIGNKKLRKSKGFMLENAIFGVPKRQVSKWHAFGIF